MNINQPNQPRKDDAVLGGENPPPINAAVLGGIQGVKARLNPANPIEVKIAALKDALNYGEAGLDIVIQALQENPLLDIKLASYQLLKEREEPQIKSGLSNFNCGICEDNFDVITVNRNGLEISRQKHSAYCFKEDIGNGIILEMVYIPGGTFLMGSPETEAKTDHDEKPQHQVTIPPFFMGKYTATQAQWKAVAQLPKIERDLDPDPSRFKGDNRPVEEVSWLDAVEFCARLSKKTGRNYRLPSEAEWEYACRAGTTTPFHFGETITTDLANYNGNYIFDGSPRGFHIGETFTSHLARTITYVRRLEEFRNKTTDVGSFPPNAFGLYDMHGNVAEWCADPWHSNYNGAPTDGSVWDEKDNDNRYQNSIDLLAKSRNDKIYRLLRGGSWLNHPRYSRSALRYVNAPDTRSHYSYGFRFVCVAAWT
jgi:formylglycine-generating enzyme required for sulfatase activity